MEQAGQVGKVMCRGGPLGKGRELVIPNPKLKLMGQVHDVMREAPGEKNGGILWRLEPAVRADAKRTRQSRA